MNRCKWKNLETNSTYIEYHDKEWGVVSRDDRHLFEMLILESFHCGLSWLIILKKREAFRSAFDGFEMELVARYDQAKIEEFLTKTKFNCDYLFGVMTYGIFAAEAVNHLQEIGTKADHNFDYISTIRMVDTWIPGFKMESQIKGEHKKIKYRSRW